MLEAKRLKAEGVKTGVSDLFLPVPQGACHGLWVELKAPKRKPTNDQAQWIERMRDAGYQAAYSDNWEDARFFIEVYLRLRDLPGDSGEPPGSADR